MMELPGADEAIERARAGYDEEVRLYVLRRAEALSQVEVAGRLQITQNAVSKLEHADDVRVSTLRDHLKALGARRDVRRGAMRARSPGQGASDLKTRRADPRRTDRPRPLPSHVLATGWAWDPAAHRVPAVVVHVLVIGTGIPAEVDGIATVGFARLDVAQSGIGASGDTGWVNTVGVTRGVSPVYACAFAVINGIEEFISCHVADS